jgi:3-deoxy-manno-octulosonate cytidylyltransferase (CMP-KDO synthetase)
LSKPRIIGVIPARYDSTRLPGKPLVNIAGKPMIQHVWERSKRSKLIDKLIVATDDRRIFDAVKGFGGKAVMTSKKHESGTDRIGEAVKKLKYRIVVNIQGDEPFMDPKNIDRAIKPLISDKKLNVSTLCYEIANSDEIGNPNIVKVVFDKNFDALYFSRYPLPYNRIGSLKIKYYKHIGLYVYRRDYLLKLVRMKQSGLEEAEKLEQLRILESGEKIKVVLTNIDSHSVDTEDDLNKLQAIF